MMTTLAPSSDWTWRITWQGRSWTDLDLTGQHLATLALISGDDRFKDLDISEAEIRVYPALGHQRLMNMIAALSVVATSETFGDDTDEIAAALEEVQKAPAVDIFGAVEFNRR